MPESTDNKAPEQAAPAVPAAAPGGGSDAAPGAGGGGATHTATGESSGAGQGGGNNPLGGNYFMFMMIGLLVVFYFMIMHPQRKREKARQELLSKLKVGDRVVTISGIIGEIVEISEQDAQLRIDARKDVRMRVRRAAIAGLAGDAASEEAAKDGGGQAG